tara:strand:- start:11485 stop:11898 length:414 start_codon:yes stop_codon:yes gene_type:complete
MVDYASMLGLGAIAGLGMLFFFIILVVYVYFAWAYMTIAKKLGYEKAWLAWIPIANIFLLPILAKKHWAWGFIFFVPIVGFVFMIMWLWNIYEQRNYPGWLSLALVVALIPLIGLLGHLAHIVITGLVAWSDRQAQI